MNIRRSLQPFGSIRPTGAVIRHAVLLAVAAWGLAAQTVAGNLAVHGIAVQGANGLPVQGPSVIDASQNVYIAGGGGCAGTITTFRCFPIQIVKVNASGVMVFNNSILPASAGPQAASDLAVDPAGHVYVVGTVDTVTSGGLIVGGFAAKLSADGSTNLYLTNLPAALATPTAIRLDAQGNAYIAGATADYHPFVTKLSADGSTFLYTVQFTGSGTSQATPDKANALAVDDAGNVVVTGQTSSADFPVTAGVLGTKLAAAPSAFVAKLDPNGKIVFASFLGGAGGANGESVQWDSAGNIYVAGEAGAEFPTTPGVYQPVPLVPLWSTGQLGFAARLKPDGSAISWATYLSNAGNLQLAVSSTSDVYVATSSGAGLQTTASAPQPCFGELQDVVVLHLNAQGGLADSTYLGLDDSYPLGLTLPGDGSVLVAGTTLESGPVLAQIRFGGPGWTAAACLSPDVLNAADFLGGGVSPGEFVTLTGFGIGPDQGLVYQPGPKGQAPLSLGGVTVSFNGIPAPLIYVQSRQVNAQVPFEATGNPAAVTLTYNGATFGPFVMETSESGAQGIFRLQPGVSTQAAALNQDGSVNGPSNPAARGSVISLFGTGYGPLVPPCTTGALNPPGAVPLVFTGAPVVWTGGTPQVEYEGSAPTLLCGIAQLNIVVPAEAPSGSLLLTEFTAGRNSGSTIFVK